MPGEPTLPAQTLRLRGRTSCRCLGRFGISRIQLRPFWDTVTTRGTPISNAGATLGRVLFYDKRLSILNTHSCGSCHEQARGFTTADRFPVGVLGVPLMRNAHRVHELSLQPREKWFIDSAVLSNISSLLPIPTRRSSAARSTIAVAKLQPTPFYPPAVRSRSSAHPPYPRAHQAA